MMSARLLFTAQQRAAARNKRSVGYVLMPPLDFLRLTMPPGVSVSQWIQANQKADRLPTLDTYNEYTRERSNTQMPHLELDWGKYSKPAGRVVAHEGRHRAAAVKVAGGTQIPVALYVVNGLKAPQKLPVPEVFTGQWNHNQTYKFDSSKFTSFQQTTSTCLKRIQSRLNHG
jgi:hypothetical protein